MEQYSGKKICTFQDRFVELCENKTMSDTALAKALHVSKQTISAWKIGTRSPKIPTVIAISDYFKVNIAWLNGFDVEKERKSDETARVIPIVVPDSERFVKLVKYMPEDDYQYVMHAFERAEKRLKEEEEKENDQIPT